MKYKAFISYRHSENGRRHAAALETALKRYAKPTLARPMPLFRDEKHMKPDISLPRLIREGLENSEYLIFLAEKSSAESQWCGEELECWCSSNQLNRTQNLVIVLIDNEIALNGTTGVNWDKTDALPALLQAYLPSIPLYVDLRWAKTPADTDLLNPRYRHEINSLSARLRGVTPEELNDEEIRVYRRNLRLRNGVIGTLMTLLLVLAGATWWALKQQSLSENRLLENYANDLAYKSSVALEQGDRNTAFRLAEFAHLYAQPDNPKAVQSMINALYAKRPPGQKEDARAFQQQQDLLNSIGEQTDTLFQFIPQVFALEGFDQEISCLEFSPDGKWMASGHGYEPNGSFGTEPIIAEIHVWDLEKRKQRLTLMGDSSGISALAFSANRKLLAAGFGTGGVRVWSLESGSELYRKDAPVVEKNTADAVVKCLKFIENDRKLAIAYGHGAVALWPLQPGAEEILYYKDIYDAYIKEIAFSMDGTRVAMGFFNYVEVYDLYTGKKRQVLQGEAFSYLSSLAFSPDGTKIAVGYSSPFALLELWDIPAQKLLYTIDRYTKPIDKVVFSPDGKFIAMGGGNENDAFNTIDIVDVKTGETRLKLNGHSEVITQLAYSADGTMLAGSSPDKQLKIWELSQKNKGNSITLPFKYEYISISPDGTIAALGLPNQVKIMDLTSGREIHSWPGIYNKVAYAPNGRYLVAYKKGAGGGIVMLDVQTGKELLATAGNEYSTKISFSDGINKIAISTDNQPIAIWDIKTGKKEYILDNKKLNVIETSFLSKNRLLVSTRDSLVIFNLDNRRLEKSILNKCIVAISPRRTFCINETMSGQIEIVDLATYKVIAKLEGLRFRFSRLAISPDERKIAIFENEDLPLKIWDAATGRLIYTIDQAGDCSEIQFSSDGRRLYTGDAYSDRILTWFLEGDDLVRQWRKNGSQAHLTKEQLKRYSLDNLLELNDRNESILIDTRETWQIAAFADLYAEKITRSDSPRSADYERAKRLYQACIAQKGNEVYFARKLAALEKIWRAR